MKYLHLPKILNWMKQCFSTIMAVCKTTWRVKDKEELLKTIYDSKGQFDFQDRSKLIHLIVKNDNNEEKVSVAETLN